MLFYTVLVLSGCVTVIVWSSFSFVFFWGGSLEILALPLRSATCSSLYWRYLVFSAAVTPSSPGFVSPPFCQDHLAPPGFFRWGPLEKDS